MDKGPCVSYFAICPETRAVSGMVSSGVTVPSAWHIHAADPPLRAATVLIITGEGPPWLRLSFLPAGQRQ